MANTLSSGVSVSRYRIVEPIGKGGMGEVYKAWDPSLDRAIALKILPAELVTNGDGRDRKLIVKYDRGRLYDFAFSTDGKHLFTIRGDERNDVVLLTNFR